ncbi:MAG: hypothetical protein FWC62_01705 [Firmicutes bacterium]|nr:hypothetical protein [Bacillota bacterium]
MRTMDTIEQEINQIRLNIYEKTKHMTPQELTAYYHQRGEKIAKEFGFKFVESTHDRPSTP